MASSFGCRAGQVLVEACERRRLFSSAIDVTDFTGYVGGGTPIGGVIADPAGDLFGAATGGANGQGTLYEVRAGTALPTAIAVFTGGTTDGGNPAGPLLRDASGDLFGRDLKGGPGGEGVLFELPVGSHDPIALADNLTTLGGYPQANLVSDSAGDLFGASSSGTPATGQVFEWSAAAGHPVTLRPTPRVDAGGLAIASDGDLYGLSESGGTAGNGVLFKIESDNGSYQTVDTVAQLGSIVAGFPYDAPVLDASGDVFFATLTGVSELPAGSDTVLSIYSLQGTAADLDPFGPLTIDASGDLFGATTTIGSATSTDTATVFELAADRHVAATLATIDLPGDTPLVGPLSIRADGAIFGIARHLDAAKALTANVFEVPPATAPLSAAVGSLTASATAVSTGGTVTFTYAAYAGSNGDVSFIANPGSTTDQSVLGSAPVSDNGTATFSTILTATTNEFQTFAAIYGGDGTLAPATSAPVTVGVVVARYATSVAVTNPGQFGYLSSTASGAFDVFVTPSAALPLTDPTGTVTLRVGDTVLGQSPINANGVATFATPNLPIGVDDVSVDYSGDAWFVPATSAPTIMHVTGPGPQLSVDYEKLPQTAVTGAVVKGDFRLTVYETVAKGDRDRVTGSVFLSADDMLDASDTPLGLGRVTASLTHAHPRQEWLLPVRSVLPAQLTGGTYHYLARFADAAGQYNVIELGSPLEVEVPAPDLTTVLPTRSMANPKFLPVTIDNRGTAAAIGTLTIDVTLTNGTLTSSSVAHLVSTIRLPRGNSLTYRLPVIRHTNLAGGAYHPAVTATFNGSSTTTIFDVVRFAQPT